MPERHSLLRRQLKRFLPKYHTGELVLNPEWEAFINAVDSAYHQSDSDRQMLERSLEFSSAELNQANSELRAIVQAFPDQIVRFDEQGKVLQVRGGKDTKELNQRLLPFEHGNLRSSQVFSRTFIEALDQTRRSLSPVSVEYSLNQKDGERYFEARLLPFGKNEAIAIIRDISERKLAEDESKRLELQLRRAQKLEAIGRLAGGIAHDFNNMLFSILGYTQLTLKKLDPESQLASNLQEVIIAGNRAKEIVEQILIFSRWRKKEKIAVRLNPIIAEVLNMLQPTLPKNIEVRRNLDTQAPSVLAEPTQMHQIITNLITNSIHAMQESGGVLEIALAGVTLKSPPPNMRTQLTAGEYVKLTVVDTGHGITAEVLERIFEPFFTTKDVGQGTGLGLSAVHGIVQDAGGGVSVVSRPNEGTTFDIYLPASTLEKEIEASNVAQLETKRGTGRVLVVDDERALVMLLAEMLESLGYKVTATTDPIYALELFSADPGAFDLIMTDQTMPGLRGLKLAEQVRQMLPHFPVILCTGFSESMTPEQALAEGCKACLIKPISIEELSNEVARVLAQSKEPEVK